MQAATKSNNETKEHRMSDTPPSLDAVYSTPVGQLLEMDETELRRLLAKAELVCRWLRGALRLKTQKGAK